MNSSISFHGTVMVQFYYYYYYYYYYYSLVNAVMNLLVP